MVHRWKIIKPETEIDKLMYGFTSIIRSGWIEVGEENTTMPLCYKDVIEDIENFRVKNNDIFIMSYPKTGTTWSLEMAWMTYHYDFEKGQRGLGDRCPFLEFKGIQEYHSENFKSKFPQYVQTASVTDSINYTSNLSDNPRIVKCHLPWSLLPRDIREDRKQPKIIYVTRNPKDTCISFYHHSRLLEGYRGSLNDFSKLFLAGKCKCKPAHSAMDVYVRLYHLD